MAFSANFEHTYTFGVSGSTYATIEQAAIEEAKRYYGESADFTILSIEVEPHSYSFEHGVASEPNLPLAAAVTTRMREPLEGGNTRANRRTTREDRARSFGRG